MQDRAPAQTSPKTVATEGHKEWDGESISVFRATLAPAFRDSPDNPETPEPGTAKNRQNRIENRLGGKVRLFSTFAAAACTTLLLGATTLAAPPAEARAITHRLDIPAQDLGAALKALGAAANEQVLFSDDVVAGLHSPQLKGEYSTDEAVTLLLKGSGLKADRTPSGVLLIRSPESTSPKGVSSSLLPLGEGSLRLAQGDSPDTHETPDPGTAKEPNQKGFWSRFRLAQADTASRSDASSRSEEQKTSENSSENSQKRIALEEVVVTAQKREQSIIDVPMSVVALSAEELTRRRISSTMDIALAVPGIGVQDRGGSNSRYVLMRGLGNTRGSQPMVGIYLDEQDVTSSPFYALDLRAYDLERLEVLRGPQGTLYGSGAMGGVLRYITKRVDLSATSSDAYVSASATDDGAPSQSAGGSLNVPLVPEVFGLRMSGFYENSGGWIDQPALSKEDINDHRLYSLRLKGLWAPMDSFEVSLMAMAHRNDTGGPNFGEDAAGNFAQLFSRGTTPSGSHDYETYNVTAKYAFQKMELISSSGYFDQRNTFEEAGLVLPIAVPPALPLQSLTVRDDLAVKSFVQEIRLSSVGTERLNWTSGATYRNARHLQTAVTLSGTTTPPANPLVSPVGNSTESWAVFGEAGMKAGDRLTLGAGLRYYEDRQTNKVTGQTGLFDELSPRFFATFALNDTTNLYANVAKGFRSGGFNSALAISRGAPPSYESDTVWSYELGTKGSLAQGKVQFDVAGFYGDYQGAQNTGIVLFNNLPVSITGNISVAKIKGIDWDIGVLLTGAFSAGVRGEYLDAKYTEIDAVSASVAVDDRLQQVPRYHAGVWTMYVRESGWPSGGRNFLRVDYGRQDGAEYRNRSIRAGYFSAADAVDTLNATLGWEKGAWSIDLFAHNLLNERGFIDAEVIDRAASRPRPRTYGLNVRGRY